MGMVWTALTYAHSRFVVSGKKVPDTLKFAGGTEFPDVPELPDLPEDLVRPNRDVDFATDFFNNTHICERTLESDEKRQSYMLTQISETEECWQPLCYAFERELERYSEKDLLELYILIELASSEKWPDVFIETMAGRFFTFLRTHAAQYFIHDPAATDHPLAGPYPRILYVTYWLNFCQVQNFDKMASLPSWFPQYPKKFICMADVVCNNRKALSRVNTVWKAAFKNFHSNTVSPPFESMCWWADTWLQPSWAKHLRKVVKNKGPVRESEEIVN